MTEDLVKALADLEEKEALRMVKERLDAGVNPLEIIEDSRKGVETVGKRFADNEYFIPDLVYSGEILKEVTEIVKAKMAKTVQIKRLGKIIIGTVSGDIHDIGKNVVTFMMDVNGFEVYDLGVDVPPQKFVEKIEETKVGIVGLSGLLTLAFDSMKETIEAIEAAGLRNKVKVMIGGAQVDEAVRKHAGADAYCTDAMAGVLLAREWLKGR